MEGAKSYRTLPSPRTGALRRSFFNGVGGEVALVKSPTSLLKNQKRCWSSCPARGPHTRRRHRASGPRRCCPAPVHRFNRASPFRRPLARRAPVSPPLLPRRSFAGAVAWRLRPGVRLASRPGTAKRSARPGEDKSRHRSVLGRARLPGRAPAAPRRLYRRVSRPLRVRVSVCERL